MSDAAPKVWDVPPLIALGALGLAAAVVLPIAHRTPLYPTSLPPLAIDGSELLGEHRRDLQRPRPPATNEALAAWNSLTLAHSRRGGNAKVQAQAQFAQTLFDATDGAPERALAIRSLAAQRWLDALPNWRPCSLPKSRSIRRSGARWGGSCARPVGRTSGSLASLACIPRPWAAGSPPHTFPVMTTSPPTRGRRQPHEHQRQPASRSAP